MLLLTLFVILQDSQTAAVAASLLQENEEAESLDKGVQGETEVYDCSDITTTMQKKRQRHPGYV